MDDVIPSRQPHHLGRDGVVSELRRDPKCRLRIDIPGDLVGECHAGDDNVNADLSRVDVAVTRSLSENALDITSNCGVHAILLGARAAC